MQAANTDQHSIWLDNASMAAFPALRGDAASEKISQTAAGPAQHPLRPVESAE